MTLDLDTMFFVGFLAISLLVGLFYCTTKSSTEHTIGDGKFSMGDKSESVYCYVGLFTIISVFVIMHFMPIAEAANHEVLLNILYFSSLSCAAILFTRPMWSISFKREEVMTIFQMIAVPYMLIFMPLVSFMINPYGQLSAVVLVINVVIFGLVVRWQFALCAITLMSFVAMYFYKVYNVNDDLSGGVKFKIIGILLLMSSILIAFLKPKQEEQEKTEKSRDHLCHRVKDQNEQILILSNLKHAFLHNLQHETNTPVTGVYAMSQALRDCYDKLNDEQRKNAIDAIVTNAERLISYANNLIGVSKLTSLSCNLNMREVNLSNLLEECIRKCKALYIPKGTENNREFVITIKPNLKAACDEYYIRKSFENLLTNAVQYCAKGIITITLEKHEDNIRLCIKDSGIGIPEEDLTKIFDTFTTSTKTHTPATGRGMGLALVKATVEVHKGTISAYSDGKTGSTFTLILPKTPSL